MRIDNKRVMERLQKPKGIVDVVFDTDTYNEIDDQYALAYLIKNTDKLNIKAIYAAPFLNDKSSSPLDGMEKSYTEIMNILSLMECNELKNLVHKGSERFLMDENTPVYSDAANDLANRAMDYSEANPLYVIAVGAITNIASALLIKPEIKDRIVLIWLGGNAYHWHDNKEFNLYQDVAGARIVFGCGVPLVQLPCKGVVSAFTTGGPELEFWLRGKSKLCDYLIDATTAEAKRCNGGEFWTRTIWDVTAVAWLLEGNYMLERFEPSPIPEYNNTYTFDKERHPIKYVYHINRDSLFGDLFTKLTK